ncbi:hypothetical protein H920_19952 [Fukomys damarensis]|uniref:Uncharacterized protein n=1 Tax=Fukomys damarensis TaxID=885580 RepID=A0A091D7F5_FUKDA|nr:hypothetical protein H920_19952 [Fukomys damarensis]
MLRMVSDLAVEGHLPQLQLALGEKLLVALLILQTFVLWEQLQHETPIHAASLAEGEAQTGCRVLPLGWFISESPHAPHTTSSVISNRCHLQQEAGAARWAQNEAFRKLLEQLKCLKILGDTYSISEKE